MSTTATAAPDLWSLLQQSKAVPAGHAANGLDIARAVESGFPMTILTRLMTLRLLDRSEVSLVMPLRTFQHRKATRARLTTDESDRVVRLAELTVMASAALGDVERGRQWLRTSNTALRGARPIDMVRTSEGSRIVLQILGRIEHGIGF